MLYPKRDFPLSAEDFANPGSEYRAAPFWAWNCKLDAQELTRQIEVFKKMGFGGFHMHVRTGLDTQYLGDEYEKAVLACVEKARAEHMLAWLYDEDRWPSGAAGGLVTKNVQWRARFLRLTRQKSDGNPIACYDIRLSDEGYLAHYKRIGDSDDAVRSYRFKLYAYLELEQPSGWYNNQTYVNTLDPAAMREFINVTHEWYAKRFGKYFGGLIPAIFTDEPQFSHKKPLTFAISETDVILPWTDDLPETFDKAYGEDIMEALPELVWELRDGVSSIRYHYHDHVAERFASAFADQIGAWCGQHNIMLTGHMMEEPTLQSQTAALGEAMRSLRSFQLPGIDMLCDWRELTTAKQAQSVAKQYGRPGVLSELYGVTNWDFDFRRHKVAGDWQACLGVTVRVPHLSWVSMAGEAKRDYPATFNYQIPWADEYKYIEDHFARLASVLTRGKAVTRVGVIHPIESCWLHFGDSEHTELMRKQMDTDFTNLADWLLKGLIDFDFISESLLPDICDVGKINRYLPVGNMNYEIIIVPNCETLRKTTVDLLERFTRYGGYVIILGSKPKYVDAKPVATLPLRHAAVIPYQKYALLNALESVRDIDIRDDDGAMTDNLIYQLREENDCKWLFIACASSPDYDGSTAAHSRRGANWVRNVRLTIKGCYGVQLYDTLTGEIQDIAFHSFDRSTVVNERTVVSTVIYDHDSVLLKLRKKPTEYSFTPALLQPASADRQIVLPNTVPIRLSEPNALVLDMAEFSLDGEIYERVEEILRLDNILRDRLGWPTRFGSLAQPWVENDQSAPETLRLRYRFHSLVNISGAKLALENAEKTIIKLNGFTVFTKPEGFYVDKSIGCVALPDIHEGINVIDLSIPYGRKTDVEAIYLIGEFGVNIVGTEATLTSPITQLAFGDITHQGLPFYGGNVTYIIDVDVKDENQLFTISASNYRGGLISVDVAGERKGIIAFAPYELKINGLSPGINKLELTLFGTRINTFGQLHNTKPAGYTWWGPQSWRTTGAQWSYNYQLTAQGILTTPEFIIKS
ncbi:MAG: hypothetical protein LBL96_05735 [Clostridiales bacterium]|jgi:hypothetical protein|nr:hypothetical protein [Clostridiales bacterium]